MDEHAWTHATWRVRPGREAEFVEAWLALSEVLAALPARPLWGTLLRSAIEPGVFYSFGPWGAAADVAAMRDNPAVKVAIDRVVSLCTEASPQLCTQVAHATIPSP